MRVVAPCPFQPKESDRTESGFYCNKCGKVVEDMTRKEVSDFDKEDWQGRCGIFRSDQLEVQQVNRWRSYSFTFFVILAMMGWNVGPVRGQVVSDTTEVKKDMGAVKKDGVKFYDETLDHSKNGRLHWWQFRKIHRRRKSHFIGCPSF